MDSTDGDSRYQYDGNGQQYSRQSSKSLDQDRLDGRDEALSAMDGQLAAMKLRAQKQFRPNSDHSLRARFAAGQPVYLRHDSCALRFT